MSGQISTPAAAPDEGCTKYASHVPSGVLISTSRSLVACALASSGSIMATPAASSTPNCLRVTSPLASSSATLSAK